MTWQLALVLYIFVGMICWVALSEYKENCAKGFFLACIWPISILKLAWKELIDL